MEGTLVDDAALWKENRELDIEQYKELESVEEPEFLNVGEAGELPGLEEEDDEERTITNRDVNNNLNALKLTEPTANLIVSLMDILLPNVAFFLSKKQSDKQLVKLDADEKEALTSAFANYLKETQFNLSPGAVLITAIAGIYVPKFATIYIHRNEQEPTAGNTVQGEAPAA